MNDQTLTELLNKQAISDRLAEYCRALDRMDKALAYSIWHSDGSAHYLDMYEGSGHGFVDWVWQAHADMERHSHQIANSLIKVEDDLARSESYVTVALWTLADEDGAQTEIIGRGRYLDNWSQRDGIWALDHRVHVLDLQTVNELHPGYINADSRRDNSDPSYDFFK